MEREEFGDPKRACTSGYRFSGSSQQFPGQRFCFTCGDPDQLMRQCTSQRGRGGPQPNFSF
ncbi:hypothetical protein R3W88_031468 [Solanum pinnatisectum]|uniref:CCHC-type domain-containing protein n=1 Tax=Solanum pinnatisectum TaxID=50273 RepID=A0AAV9LLF2_9SOLN|nr:hypothetical protein R3W88_031468 [Solanum pinnatisectum]